MFIIALFISRSKITYFQWSVDKTLVVIVQLPSRIQLLWPHELQHSRPPCPSSSSGVCPTWCPLNQWCHPTILCSVVPFSFCLQSFLASGSFRKSQFFHIKWPRYWSSSINSSHSNEYLGVMSFRTDWFDLLAVQGTVKSLLQHHCSKASILGCSAFFIVQLSHSSWLLGKP